MPDAVPDNLWTRTMAVHDAALAPSTRVNYGRAYDRFREWVAAERLGRAALALPTPEPVLCAFAASFAGAYSGGAARSAMAAMRFVNEQNGAVFATSPRLSRILTAVTQQAPPDSHREPRPPVTLAMIDEVLDKLDDTRGFDQCVAAAMLVAFWGQLRLGEILSVTRAYDFESLPVGKHAHLRRDAGGLASQVTSAIWLPRTKIARTGEWVWLAKHFNDPSFALQEHMTDNRVSRDDPLFSYRDRHDSLVPLTKNAFLSRLNEIWTAAGMCRISGHCFRIGGTTALLRLGVDTEVVKVSGRWSSDSFLRYWRSVDNIIASHTDLVDLRWKGD